MKVNLKTFPSNSCNESCDGYSVYLQWKLDLEAELRDLLKYGQFIKIKAILKE